MTTAQLLQSNLELMVTREPQLIAGFYGTLFARYPQVKPLFNTRHSAEHQQKMLAEALTAVVGHIEDAAFVENTMLAVGRKHVEYGVEDHMYPWVAECLIATFRETSGDDWSDEIAAAWTDALNGIAGIALRGAALARAES